MKNHWRLLYSFLPEPVERRLYKKYFAQEHKRLMQSNSQGCASNLQKQEALRNLQREYGLRTLVETGTYLGDTLYSLYPDFEKLYSIELSPHFFDKARKRFKNYKKITLVQGDSSTQLGNIVNQLTEPALFWLDGHYSGGLTAKGDKECPIYEELTTIFRSPLPHVIVIDDARCFVGKNDYPTIEELTKFIQTQRPNSKIVLGNDSIKILHQ